MQIFENLNEFEGSLCSDRRRAELSTQAHTAKADALYEL